MGLPLGLLFGDPRVPSWLHGSFLQPEAGLQGMWCTEIDQWTSTAQHVGNTAPHLYAQRNRLGDVQHLESVVFN